MTTPKFSSRFAEDVARALEQLPDDRAVTAGASERRRSVVVTILVAAALLPVVAVALLLSPRQGDVAAPSRETVASCDAAGVQPFGCDSYSLSTNGNISAPSYAGFRAWFDQLNGEPRFVVDVGSRLRSIPLRLVPGGAELAQVPGRAAWPQLETCQSVEEANWTCRIDRQLHRLVLQGGRLEHSSGRVSITAGNGAKLVAVDRGRPHVYAPTEAHVLNRRVLLTNSSEVQLDAATTGAIGVNIHGCLTIGDQVLVLSDDTVLQPDGSLTGHGRKIQIGQRVSLGGASGSAPADQQCGTGGYWYGWIP